jgi:glycosyltransferase involved in cell wall biosynthesis
MRIAFFTDTFLPQVNGVATSIAHFARELGSRGHQVLIVCPAPNEKRTWSAKNVRVVDLPSIPAFLYPNFRVSPLVGIPRTLLSVARFKPDIIHFHTTVLTSADALIAAKVFGTPLVGTNHVLLSAENDEYLSFVASNKTVRRYLTKAVLGYAYAFYGSCDVRIAPSKMLIEELRRTGYRKAITYLPNAVPVPVKKSLPAKQRRALRERYRLRGNVVLHVGRLSYEKSVDVVLRAFALLVKTEDATLLIVGDGPHRRKLEALAKTLGIAKRTVFTGFIPPSELLQSGVFGVADAFCTASTMESQGMVLVEAMAFGIPLVAVAEGAVPEVVGDSGMLVRRNSPKAIADTLKKLFTDPSLHRSMAAKSLRRHRYFALPAVTDKLLRVYQRAVDTHAKKPPNGFRAVTSRYVTVPSFFRKRT